MWGLLAVRLERFATFSRSRIVSPGLTNKSIQALTSHPKNQSRGTHMAASGHARSAPCMHRRPTQMLSLI